MTRTASLEGIEDQLAEDARATAKELERSPTVPPMLQAKVRAMFRELVDAQNVALQSSAPLLAMYLSEPVQALNQLLGRDRLDAPEDRDQVRLACLAISQAVERYREGAGIWATLPLHELVDWLIEVLGVSKPELGDLLAVDARTIRRWAGQETTPQADEVRIRNLARLVTQLRMVFTPRGTLQWLTREIPAKHRVRAIDMLDDDAEVMDLEQAIWHVRGG